MLRPRAWLIIGAGVTAVALLSAGLVAQTAAPARDWPQWRGPDATGASSTANPPLEWSEQKNVRWKVEIPGRGSASPIVWGDRVYLLTAVPAGTTVAAQHAPRGGQRSPGMHRFTVMALERKTGRTAWQRVAREQAPHEGTHGENGTWASSSPLTDGERLYAWFESAGLFVYDLNGTLLWQRDFGDKQMRNEFGEGTSPALHGHTLVVVWDHQGESFIVALDTRTGKELWRTAREEIDSWATPIIVTVDGRPQVVVGAMDSIQAYDLQTGRVVWTSSGLTMNPIPSPVAGDGLVFLMSGFRGSALKAIRPAGAKGTIDNTNAVVWTLNRDTPYVPSPVLADGILYFLKSNSGILTAVDAVTGTPHYANQRVDGVPNVFASPVAVKGRLYIPGREGTTTVIRSGPTFEVLARNVLDDGFDASPALVDGEIFLRGQQHLYAIAQ